MLMGLCAACAMAQQQGSGDIFADFQPLIILGTAVIRVIMALTGIAFVGGMIWGSITLITNRPKGMAIIASALVGSLIASLAVVIVSHLTGASISIT